MYPLKFNNIYHTKVWGGRDFETFRENLPKGKIGESWDIACHSHGTSVVVNGQFKGVRLERLIEIMGEELIGTKISKDYFPLLIKIINAREKLSVQVHPDDKYATINEGEMGKTEIWYVMEAFEGANLVLGTKNIQTKEEFKRIIEAGNLEKYLNEIEVKKGDVYFIKSGLIHAIGEGVVVAEIQQNSDTTYRVYDYNRGRDLHIEKALDVIDLDLGIMKCIGDKVERVGYNKTLLCLCKDFALELYDIEEYCIEKSDKERFYAFTCVEGKGEIIFKHGIESIKKGDSILIPACLGEYIFKGEMKVLKYYLPRGSNVESTNNLYK